jgi:transcriptional regulator with GAF, ATPase, and Fis domain
MDKFKDKITWSPSIVPPLIRHKSEDITKIMRKFTKKNKKFKKKKYKKYEYLCSEEEIKKLGKIQKNYKNNSSVPGKSIIKGY